MSKRNTKADKGCVGFVADGVMRKANIYVFKTNDKEPTEVIANLKQYYGSIRGKYICISNVDEVYDKFLEELKEYRIMDTILFSVSITTGNNKLKTVSGTNKSYNIKCDEGEDEEDEDKQEKDKDKDKDKEETEDKQTKSQNKQSKEKKTKVKDTPEPEEETNQNKDTDNSDSDSENSDTEEDDRKSKPKLKKKTKSTDESKPKTKGKNK